MQEIMNLLHIINHVSQQHFSQPGWLEQLPASTCIALPLRSGPPCAARKFIRGERKVEVEVLVFNIC